jgi:uncharacterized membrane protein
MLSSFSSINPSSLTSSKLLVAAISLFAIDILWLLTGGIYARHIVQKIQGMPMQMRILSAAVVYFFLAYMLLQVSSAKQAFMYGLCIYGVYDFTNHALFNDYDWKFAVADTLWGGVLFTMAYLLIKSYKFI